MDEPKTIWDFIHIYNGTTIPKPGSIQVWDLPQTELGFMGQLDSEVIQPEPDKDAKTIMDNLMQSLVILHNHAESQPGQSGDRLKPIYREYINFVLSEKTWQCIYQNYRFSLGHRAVMAISANLDMMNALKKRSREARAQLSKGSKNSGAAKKGEEGGDIQKQYRKRQGNSQEC